MRTMHPVLKRGALFWDESLLPRACYAERFARVQAQVAASGDDAWIIFGDVERYGHIAYVSNFLPRTRSAVALVPKSGEPSLLVNVGERDVPAAKTLTWVQDVRPFGKLAPRLVALIEEKGLSAARFGLVGVEEGLVVAEWAAIAGALSGAQWRNRSAALATLRQSKDVWELNALRRSAEAVARALAHAPRVLRPGVSMREIAAYIDRDLRRNAAEDVRILVGGDCPGYVPLRPADDHCFQAGACATLYVAAETQRYWAAAARTIFLGEAPSALRAMAARAAAALEDLRAAARPGVALSELKAAAERRLGCETLRAAAAAHGFGHGIGLDLEEAPFFSETSEAVIAPGATLVLQVAGQFDGWGIALADTVIASENGGESLIGAPVLVERSALEKAPE